LPLFAVFSIHNPHNPSKNVGFTDWQKNLYPPAKTTQYYYGRGKTETFFFIKGISKKTEIVYFLNQA